MKLDKPISDGNSGPEVHVPGRRYQRRVREFVKAGQVEPAARDAERYVERSPDDAARAEARARRGPRSPWVTLDELVAKSHTVVDRMELLIRRIARRFSRR